MKLKNKKEKKTKLKERKTVWKDANNTNNGKKQLKLQWKKEEISFGKKLMRKKKQKWRNSISIQKEISKDGLKNMTSL